MSRPMRELMQCRGRIRIRRGEGFGARHDHLVMRRYERRTVAAVIHYCAKLCVHLSHCRRRRERRRSLGSFGQRDAFALRKAKDCVDLQEQRVAYLFLAALVALGVLALLPENNLRSVLALAYMPAKLPRLIKRQVAHVCILPNP